jgi:hypothetical protein
LGRQLLKTKTDVNGLFQFEYPAGSYVLTSLDDFNRENIIGSVVIKTGNNYRKILTGAVSFSLTDTSNSNNSASFNLYALADDGSGGYYRGNQVGSVKLTAGHSAAVSLAAGPYLAVYVGKNNQEYGQAFVAKNGGSQSVRITVSSKYSITANQSFRVTGVTTDPISNEGTKTPATTASSLAARLKGRILLQVEDKGQAWYINPTDGKKYYLGRPEDAYNVMRRVALGISNSDFMALEKNPSAGRTLVGKILLKTEDNGRAYYFDPLALKLYYLGRPSDAFNVMRTLGLGIKTGDLQKLPTGIN